MGNELVIRYPTGSMLYAHLIDATGQVWNGSAFEALQDANWGTYDLAMAEAGTMGYYQTSMPGASAGVYSFVVFLQAGGSPAVGDLSIGEGTIQWDGSAEVPISAIKTKTDLIPSLPSTLTAAQVWANETRTLTQSTAQVAEIVEGSVISVYQYTTWTISLTGLGNISTRDRLYFTIKGNLDDADDEDATILQVEETDGLLYIGGADADDSDLATLVVDDETLGNITVVVDDSVTGLANQHGLYDVKMVTASGTTDILTISTFKILSVVTKAVI